MIKMRLNVSDQQIARIRISIVATVALLKREAVANVVMTSRLLTVVRVIVALLNIVQPAVVVIISAVAATPVMLCQPIFCA